MDFCWFLYNLQLVLSRGWTNFLQKKKKRTVFSAAFFQFFLFLFLSFLSVSLNPIWYPKYISYNAIFVFLFVFFYEQIRYEDEDEDEGPQPDQNLEQGVPLPARLQDDFPPELTATPIEDIDPFYHNQRVSIGIFSVCLWFLSSFPYRSMESIV